MDGHLIQICDGCEPLTAAELYALYMLTGEHPAADEVVQSVRRKLSHTLMDMTGDGETSRDLMDADYYDEWNTAKSHRDWSFTALSDTYCGASDSEPLMRFQRDPSLDDYDYEIEGGEGE